MKLKNTLEEWLQAPPKNSKKRGGDDFPFYSKYESFKFYLDSGLHKETTKQAIYEEYKEGKDINTIVFLNDHGSFHIKTVIERASQLLCYGGDINNLNPREVFFLLNAIQVHDLGNFYGRYGHESKILEAINKGLVPILFDRTEVTYFQNIAKVHGGKLKKADGTEDKNTITKIKPLIVSDGYDVRLQLLAAILRFSDELADDKYRADIVALNTNKLPKGSEIFHAYASCLDTVKVNHQHKQIELHFKVPKNFVTRTFGKIQSDKKTIKDQYLLDEIYERAMKMHIERIYCSKFWKHFINIENIWVQIEFYSNALADDVFDEESLFVHSDITFSLNDNHFPHIPYNIFEICPTLVYGSGVQLTGENLFNEITKTSDV